MREIRTSDLMRGKSHRRQCRDVGLYATTVTHIVQPLKELGEKSVEVLVNMIGGKPAEKIVLKPAIKLGGSTDKLK